MTTDDAMLCRYYYSHKGPLYYFNMCASNFLLLIAIVFAVPLICFWHLSIRANQRGGQVSGAYQLDTFERFIEIFPILCIALVIFAVLGVENFTQNVDSISLTLFGSTHVLSPLLFMAPLVLWSILVGTQQRAQIRRWLGQRNLSLVKMKSGWCWDGNPWQANTGMFISGTSDSQTTYKVIVEDEQGAQRVAFILWGGYFGLSWLTGEIPIELVWETPDESQKLLREAAERVAEIRKKDPDDLMKPRW